MSHDGIHKLDLNADLFINKTTILVGRTKSGKTFFIKNILSAVKEYMACVFVICPTDGSHGTYSDIIDAAFIYDIPYADTSGTEYKDPQKYFFKKFYDRQKSISAVYRKANEIKQLKHLAYSISKPNISKFFKHEEDKIKKEYKMLRRKLENVKDRSKVDNLLEEMRDRRTKKYNELYKTSICKYEDDLLKHNESLSSDIQHTLKYFDINPHVLLILDDCAADLKRVLSSNVFRPYFYQNRWCNISLIIACQDDSDLPPNLRKNASTIIFTTSKVAQCSFDRKTDGHTKSETVRANKYISEIFKDDHDHMKMAYIQDDPTDINFYAVKAKKIKLKKVKLDDSVKELCVKLKPATSSGFDKLYDNRFA